MNNKFKVVSSLALAGIMALSSFNLSKTFAADANDTIKTNPVGVYRDLVKGKTVAPFVLVEKNDVVSVKEITESEEFGNVTQFNGANISLVNQENIVKTGDTFIADGETFTVIIYGDIYKDGLINSNDSRMVDEYSAKINQNLDELQLEAADVDANDGKINSNDSRAIKEYSAKLRNTVISATPDKEKAPETLCTVELTDKYVNNRNLDTVPAVITMNSVLTNTVSDAKIVKVKDDGTYDSSAVVSSIELTKNTTKIEKTFNFSSLDEGKTTLKLVSNDEKTVYATFTADKHTTEINNAKLAQVKAIRDNTKEASISFEAYGDNIVKMYYDKLSSSFTGFSSDKSTATDTALSALKSLDITDNKVVNQKVYTDLTNNTGADLYYVLVDEYGSVKVEATTPVKIAKDENKDPLTTIKSVTIDELTNKSNYNTVNVKWELEKGSESNQTFVITLYKDGKAVAETTIADVKTTTMDQLLGFDTIMTKQAGTYKIGIYAKATSPDDKNPSDTVFSNEVTVTALKPVTDITFNINANQGKVLTWNSDYSKDDIAGYKVKLVKVDNNLELDLNNGENVTATTYTIDNVKDNNYETKTIYKAVVYVEPKTGTLATIESPVATSKEFFTIDKSTVNLVSKTSNSVKLQLTPIVVKDKTTKYKVEVWEKTGTDGLEAATYTNTGRIVDITPDKQNQFVIDGLTAGHTYIFKILADVEGIQAISELAPTNGVTLYKELPSLENLTVVADNSKTKENEIAKISTGGLSISGVNYTSTEIADDYSSELGYVNSLLGTDLKEGDKFTYTSGKLIIKLPNKAESTTPRTFSNKLANKILELEGSPKNQVKITTNPRNSVNIKELILKGSNAIYDISGLTQYVDETTKKITVQNGVEIVNAYSNKDLVIAEGSTVSVNGIKITTAEDLKITANAQTITVNEDDSAAKQNDLVFENISTSDATIKFSGKDNDTSRLNGSITLKSTGAKITVDHENMSIDSTVNVTVENGKVDISDDSFTGAKKVNVTVNEGKNAELTVTPAKEIPTEIASFSKNYVLTEKTAEEIKKDTTNFGSSLDDTKAQAIKDFLDSFGLNDKGVEIAIASGKVTLTFTKAGTYTLTSESNGIK